MAPASDPGTVLVVDDEELNRHLYGALLTKAGFRVELAQDGADAIEHLRASECAPWSGPDVVLLDFLMPHASGPEVLRWMRGTPTHGETPVVLLTASGDAAHVAEAFDAGADDYLLKPINPRILLARVRSAIAARRAALRARQADRALGDLEDARSVQLAQIPSFPTARGGVWITGSVTPSGHVGGDLVDVVDLDDGSSVAVLVDVAGHGIGAALVASAIRSELRFLLTSHPIDRAILELGRRLLADGSRHVCVGAVQIRGREYAIVNAGLPPIWIGPPTAPRQVVASSGPPPGLFPGQAYEVVRGELGPKEAIVLVSDGLTEPFGLADDVGAVVPLLMLSLSAGSLPAGAPSAERLARAVLDLFTALGVEERPDDATALVVGRIE